jgi:two-component system cell cycle response regulator
MHTRGVQVRILIADDESMSRLLLQKTLERAGYDVLAVENGRQAADQLCLANGPKLALLDWVMPELDGPGVCKEVRKRKEQSYVYMVLLTSKEAKEDVVAGLGSGADDYLTKPFDAEELKARLRTGLRILDLEDRLIEAREEMRYKATHDALTSLWNRGMMLELLGRELSRSHRERLSTTILLCDIDHFKNVNDTHGHLAGDEVLQETAKRLLASVRSYDFVGRYGGEEFLVALNNCDPAYGFARAEQIRKSIEERPVQTSSGLVAVTMSLGVLLSHEWGARPVEELLQEADLALYAAKAAGRNCVKVAGPRTTNGFPEVGVSEPARQK